MVFATDHIAEYGIEALDKRTLCNLRTISSDHVMRGERSEEESLALVLVQHEIDTGLFEDTFSMARARKK